MMCRFILTTLLLATFLGCSGGERADKYMQEGFIQFQHQKYDEAIASYEKAVKLEPRAAAAYNMIGMAYRFKYLKLGVPELRQKEMAAFQKAIEIDPKNWVAMINLATSYYAGGQKDKAAPLFTKALELNPNHPEKAKIQEMIAEGKAKP
jgi:tetratricopeptide (TPR) repeat protein